MSESLLQHLIIEFLRPLIERYIGEVLSGVLSKEVAAKGHKSLRKEKPYCVGGDQLWYYEEGNPKKCVGPDVYVLAGEEQDIDRSSVKIWELAGFPLFALEIVGQNKKKDYRDSPAKFAHTGVRELVVYDPDAPTLVDVSAQRATRRKNDRFRFQVWRLGERGEWARVVATHDDRVYSETLCCWLFVQGVGVNRKLRIGLGEYGEHVFASDAERASLAEKERDQTARENEVLRARLKLLESNSVPHGRSAPTRSAKTKSSTTGKTR